MKSTCHLKSFGLKQLWITCIWIKKHSLILVFDKYACDKEFHNIK